MITNDNISSEYGSFNIPIRNTLVPPSFRPAPVTADYQRGVLIRAFMLRLSNGLGYEIDPRFGGKVDNSLYKVYTINWRIAGSRYIKKTGNVIDDYGVEYQNRQELTRVGSADKINLEKFFPNLLEYWRGY